MNSLQISYKLFLILKASHINSVALYTSEQNGCAERKHRHVLDMGKTLLFHSALPSKFWVDVFQTTVYIINKLPHQSFNIIHWELLFKASPKYHTLKTFSCACYSGLQPYAQHNLDTKSKLCVFLGYSLNHSGYKWLDLTTNIMYVSRPVVFDEFVFPFKQHSSFQHSSSS